MSPLVIITYMELNSGISLLLLSGDLLDPLPPGSLMLPKALHGLWNHCSIISSRGEKQPRLVYSSHPSMENQLIAVIVRFPSALPTTKSRGIQAAICRSTRICFITNKLNVNIQSVALTPSLFSL